MGNVRKVSELELSRSQSGASGSIQGKLFLLLFIVLIPILFVEAFGYIERFETWRKEALMENLEIARATGRAFDVFIRSVLHEELVLGNSIVSSESHEVEKIQQLLDMGKSSDPAISCIFWADPLGHIVTASEGALIETGGDDPRYPTQMPSGREWDVSALFQLSDHEQPVFVISRSIRDESNVVMGIIGVVISPEAMGSVLSLERGGEGAVILIDKEGRAVYRSPSIEWNWEKRNLLDSCPMLQDALDGKEITATFSEGFDGAKRVRALSPIRSMGWVAGAGRPEAEIMAPIISRLGWQAGLFLLVLLLSLFSAFFISRTITLPVKRLRDFALAFGRGDMESEIEISGPDELRDLAAIFGHVARRIVEREEDLLKMQDRLEAGVIERTAELEKAMEVLKTEVSERNRAEAALRQERDFVESIIETAEVIILVLDTEGRIIRINPYMEKMSGYSMKEVEGKEWFTTFLPKQNQDRIRNVFLRGVDDIDRHGTIYPIVVKDGDAREIEWYSKTLKDASGDTIGALSIGQDITERVIAQEKLRESEQRHRRIVETAREGIWLLDRDAKTIFVNSQMAEMLDYAVQEMSGSSFFDFLDEEARSEAEGFFGNRKEVISEQYDLRFRRKDGSDLWTIISANPVMDDDGLFTGALKMVTDISGRKRVEDALRKSEEELRFLSSRLLSAQEEERKRIARELHDSLGSSLSAIKISLENAKKQLEEDSLVPEFLEIPISWTQHALDEARRLMTDLRPSILDDLGLIATIGWFLRQFRKIHSNIHVEENIDMEEENIPELLKITIFRIIQEAFHNIVKHSKAELVTVSFFRSQGTLELIIEDNGDGFGLDAALSRRDDTGGLGLTSMKERAELSGGSISIESVIGEGTIIRVSWQV